MGTSAGLSVNAFEIPKKFVYSTLPNSTVSTFTRAGLVAVPTLVNVPSVPLVTVGQYLLATLKQINVFFILSASFVVSP